MYGIDVDDDALMAGRSWRWLRTRVLALLDRPPTLLAYRVGQGLGASTRLASVPSTRLGFTLYPPDFSQPDTPPN